MASGSVIQFVHKHMGLVPGWGGAARLVRIVGSQSALKLLGGALKVDPELSLQIGLADGVLEDPQEEDGVGTLLQRAEDWLSRYTKGPAPVIQAVKKVVLSGRELPLSEALRTEKDVFGMVWGGPANLQALASKHKHKWLSVSTFPKNFRDQPRGSAETFLESPVSDISKLLWCAENISKYSSCNKLNAVSKMWARFGLWDRSSSRTLMVVMYFVWNLCGRMPTYRKSRSWDTNI